MVGPLFEATAYKMDKAPHPRGARDGREIMLPEKSGRILRPIWVLLAVGLLFSAGWWPAGARADDWLVAAALEVEQRLQPQRMDGLAISRDQGTDPCGALVRFYRHRNYEPAWVDRYGLLPEAALALSVLKQADNQGLRYADYYNPWVDEVLGGMITRPVILGNSFDGKQVQLDLALTDMVLRYVYDRAMGRIDSHTIADRRGADSAPPSRDLAWELAEMLDRGRLAAFFDALGPRQTAYRALQQSLPRYRKMAAAGGWATIDEGPKLQRGDCGPRVAQLRDRLAVSGDTRLSSEFMAPCFDDLLAEAVARFQYRHGLQPDGVVGDRTLAALNVPVEARIRQIQLNLERWRWMPADLGPRYVLANIPGFQLQMVEEGHVVKTLRTIVGKQDRPTPVLTSMITYLEINPYWHVPPTIAGKDLLPKIQADPSFLIRQHFRVFDGWGTDAHEISPYAVDWAALSERYFPFRLRQEPAVGNALGRVKIMFPNDDSVYIHDTPARSLFNRTARSFSSGCVRVEEPLTLAGLLLNRQGWDQDRLTQAVATHDRQVITLEEPVPVYLVYWTAWAEPNGDVHFRDDIYGRDQTLLEAMTGSPALHTTCRGVGPHPTYLGVYHPGRRGASF
jgi:L,D-transpeptidase YcbB